MVRKIGNRELNIISKEEFRENSPKYNFEIDRILKSELGLENGVGQSNKIEKLTERIHCRLGSVEKNILQISSLVNDMSESDLIRFLILQHGKNFIKPQLEKDYLARVEKYNTILDEVAKKTNIRKELLEKRGANKIAANRLYKLRTKLKYEIENLESEARFLKNYINKYTFIFD